MAGNDLRPFLIELQRRLDTYELRGRTVDLGHGSQSAEVVAMTLLEAVRQFRATPVHQRRIPVLRQDQERLAAELRRLRDALR